MGTYEKSPPGRLRRARGTSLIEFALILPLFLILIAGLIDVGRAYSQAGIVANAARQGARYGAAHPTDTATIKSRAVEEANGSGITIDPNNVAVSTPAGTTAGQPINVRVTYEYQSLLRGVLGRSRQQIVRDCSMPIL